MISISSWLFALLLTLSIMAVLTTSLLVLAIISILSDERKELRGVYDHAPNFSVGKKRGGETAYLKGLENRTVENPQKQALKKRSI